MREKIKKNNRRSFRFSDECADILETYGYDLDAFVLDAFNRLPEVHEEVRMELETLYDLKRECNRVRNNIYELQMCAQFLYSMQDDLCKLSRRLDDIAAGRITLSNEL